MYRFVFWMYSNPLTFFVHYHPFNHYSSLFSIVSEQHLDAEICQETQHPILSSRPPFPPSLVPLYSSPIIKKSCSTALLPSARSKWFKMTKWLTLHFRISTIGMVTSVS
jgi:hypothetical protein